MSFIQAHVYGDLELLEWLHRKKVVKFDFSEDGGFPLKAHREGWANMRFSPYFIDLRTIEDGGPLSEADACWIGVQLGLWLQENYWNELSQVDAIAGIPRAGKLLGIGVYSVWERPVEFLTMRKTGDKASPLSTEIIGNHQPGMRVLLIDDVITDMKSKQQARDVLVFNQLLLEACGVVADREAGGAQKLIHSGVQLFSRLTQSGMMDGYEELNVLTAEEKGLVNGFGPYMKAYQAQYPQGDGGVWPRPAAA